MGILFLALLNSITYTTSKVSSSLLHVRDWACTYLSSRDCNKFMKAVLTVDRLSRSSTKEVNEFNPGLGWNWYPMNWSQHLQTWWSLYKLSKVSGKVGSMFRLERWTRFSSLFKSFLKISVRRGEEQMEGGREEESLLLGGFLLVFWRSCRLSVIPRDWQCLALCSHLLNLFSVCFFVSIIFFRLLRRSKYFMQSCYEYQEVVGIGFWTEKPLKGW